LSGHALELPNSQLNWPPSDKPLPPVPSSRDSTAPNGSATPYFDYIFANAGVESRVERGSPDNVSFEIDNDGEVSDIVSMLLVANFMEVIEHEICDDKDGDQADEAPSPKHFIPGTPEYGGDAVAFHNFDDAGFTTHVFLQAGISITSKGIHACPFTFQSTFADPWTELADSYRAAANTISNANFFLNEADEAEKVTASVGFFGEIAVEESPSPFHAPITDHSSGFGDIRDEAEAFPEQWQDNERRPRAYTLEEADGMFEDYLMDAASIQTRPFLTPTSRKLAVSKVHNHRHSPMAIDLTGDQSFQDEPKGTGQFVQSHNFISLTISQGENARLMTRLSRNYSSIPAVMVSLIRLVSTFL
jgi:hypothetical protein